MRTLLLALAMALAATAAQAQVKTAQFTVRAVVMAECEFRTKGLDFASYTPGSDLRVDTTFDIKCTKGAAVSINFDGGSSGNPNARAMTGPNAAIGYQLYRDKQYQDPIVSDPAFQLSAEDNKGQRVHFSVYGEVPGGQTVPVGTYSDTVRVTVSY